MSSLLHLGIPDSKVIHAAHVMAEYLDNDEDGQVDDDAVVASMVSEQATLVMFQDENEAESSGIFDAEIPEDRGFQDLYGEETNQPGALMPRWKKYSTSFQIMAMSWSIPKHWEPSAQPS